MENVPETDADGKPLTKKARAALIKAVEQVQLQLGSVEAASQPFHMPQTHVANFCRAACRSILRSPSMGDDAPL